MTNAPQITVLMPVYNGEAYLREAIDSILGQTFKDFEFLIINDGSTDRTKEIILSYTDPRIRYVENEQNLKLIASLNRGFDLARGRYIARMDADDISMPDRLQQQFEFLEQNEDIGIVGTWYQSFDQNGIISTCKYSFEHNEICYKQLYQIHLSHGTCMIREEILKRSNMRFDPSYAHAEDYDLFTRLSSVSKLANLPFVGYLVRKHDGEVSVKYSTVQQENSNKIREREFLKLGIGILSEEIDAFIQLNHQTYFDIKISKEAVANFLEHIIESNNQSNYIDKAFFEDKIKTLWFNYCYHRESFSYYKRIITLARPITFERRFRWHLKRMVCRILSK